MVFTAAGENRKGTRSFSEKMPDTVLDPLHAAHRDGLFRADRPFRAVLLAAVAADAVRKIKHGVALFELQ